ncbi:hypothetical protein TrST_g5602 [Triparma strigata]|uniref:Uncharacterized protein n=1 Tax=Triparma strigata TaxID=1606541 RepID=A0A9W6ZDI1_9STRA|nr:hypothetical protein TrST_g5602 [Triparma strigata]
MATSQVRPASPTSQSCSSTSPIPAPSASNLPPSSYSAQTTMEEMGKYQEQQQQLLVLLQQHVEALSKNRRRKSSVAIPNSVGAAEQAAAPTKKAYGVHMEVLLKATEEG